MTNTTINGDLETVIGNDIVLTDFEALWQSIFLALDGVIDTDLAATAATAAIREIQTRLDARPF